MAQPVNNVLSPADLDATDYRKQFGEVATSSADFVTADSTLILSTVPFLPIGTSFTDIPLYPVGIVQQISYNEGNPSQFVGELGSSRKVATAGTSVGSGMISRLALHGNALVAALYRPTLIWIQSTDSLTEILDRISGDDKQWLSGFVSQDLDLFGAETGDFVDRVVSAGGLSSLLYKIPFGLVEIKRDPRQRVTAINFLEQCIIQGDQAGLSAGQFQVMDSISFGYERKRALKAIGPFGVSGDSTIGL